MSDEKLIIYQVFTRLFGNNNNHCINNGSITENGCGKICLLYTSFNEPWKIDIMEFMNENYMCEFTMEEMAHYTGRSLATVSYTHLDVYKRQGCVCTALINSKNSS